MKTYCIQDILPFEDSFNLYPTCKFEETDDTPLEWPHRHNFYALVWFTNGYGFNVIDFEEFEIKPNRIFTMNIHQVHNWSYSLDSKGYFTLINPILAQELHLDFNQPFFDIPLEEIYFYKDLFQRLNAQIHTLATLQFLLTLLTTTSQEKSKESKIFYQLKQIIFKKISYQKTNDQFADELNIPISLLNKICYKNTGLTLKQFHLTLKMTEAKRRLIFTNENINEIANYLGFEDVAYFSRIFKKKSKFTPTSFRKKYHK